MADINDGSLIGFWPLNEPSGAPFFLNHSTARAGHPSGLSFDLHVAVSTTAVAIDHARSKSVWPGTTSIFNASSGTLNTGYMAQGYWKLGTDSSPYSRYLILGNGSTQSREQTLSQNVVNSGITVGVWVYPNSDGYINFATDANLATYNWETESARCHSLIGQFLYNNANGGYHLGISGKLTGAAQNSSTQFGGPNQLAAYIALESANATSPLSLRIPIESGRFTHIAFTYRFIDGTSNQVVLYKDGRVAASGTTSVELDLSNTSILSRAFGIGNSDDAAAGTNNYTGTAGWNHLLSGVYLFRRVLPEGEMLTLHNTGGLQPQPNITLPTKQVLLTDTGLVGHYPFRSVGYSDASKNHFPLISLIDEGDADSAVVNPGPFKGGGLMQNAATASTAMIATSGMINAILSSRSWSINIFAGPAAAGNGRDDNMIMSWGSISSNTANTAPTAISAATFGMALTEFGTPNRMRFSAYPVGDISANLYEIDTSTSGYNSTSTACYSVVYDDQTKGLAVYLNGIQQGSGTLAVSLTTQLIKLVGSGYPLMFGNGVQDNIVDSAARGLFAAGGNKTWFGPISVFNRPLLPSEVRFIAQSGIDISSIYRTIYDTRLMGYWPCDTFTVDDVLIEDKARVWSIFPGTLSRGNTSTQWGLTYNAPNSHDLFRGRTLPPELSSFGNLGITSGVFTVRGGSLGTNVVSDAGGARSSIGNLVERYKPVNEENDLAPQNILGEYIIGYEVTPSGRIPITLLGSTSDSEKFDFNSTLHVYGGIGGNASPTNVGELRSFLTTIDASAGSGVTIVFQGREDVFAGTAFKPLVSGRVPFGVPSKILFHSKFDSPYNVSNETTGQAVVAVELWINGILVQTVRVPSSTAKMWSAQPPNSTTESWTLNFGGEIGSNTYATQIARDGGLGEIYMRNMFVMRGIFEEHEVEALAVSGILQPTIQGYTDSMPTTQVTISDSNLEGYWRFNGMTNGFSGIRDLSLKGHNLSGIIQGRILVGQGQQTATALRQLKILPGPLANSDLLVQCSGISFVDATLTNAPFYPPFAVSGVAFNNPHAGFSVGFLLVKRNDIAAANTADVVLSYGILGSNSVSDTTINLDRGWVIVNDDNNDMKMVLSTAGNGYYDNSTDASQSGQIVCGTFEGDGIYEDQTRFDVYKWGTPRPPRIDGMAHYCWVFDPVAKALICYVDGTEVDRKNLTVGIDPHTGSTSGLGPWIPINSAAKIITFLNHQNSAPWDFNTNTLNDQASILTDVFYFSRALTDNEVRYVALNGIDAAEASVVSGVMGGFIYGQDTGSGLIGGYTQGLDTSSGIIGGIITGSTACSGLFGGYISGQVFADGTIGGFIRGLDVASGLFGGYVVGSTACSGMIAGYIRGQAIGSGLFGGLILGANLTVDIGSGLLGGFIIGALQGRIEFDTSYTLEIMAAKDFDAQLEIAQTTSSDFDAKIIIFQNELPPFVDIITPNATVSGLVPPFNQYFVGFASGQQDKTIVQTRWNFGDFTPNVAGVESGISLYPIQHNFASSGFYIVRFEAIDSDGMHGSATRIVNVASGIDPVIISLSGVPRVGAAALTVDFTTVVNIIPNGVSISARLLNFDDGQTTTSSNPTHVYTRPGTYRPIWIIRDSRGVTWTDSLEAGNDYLQNGGA